MVKSISKMLNASKTQLQKKENVSSVDKSVTPMPPKPKKKFAMNWGESTQEGEKEKDKEKDKEIDTSVMPMFSKPKKQFAMNWGESTQEKEKDKEINTSVMPMFSKPKKKFAMNWDDNTKIENQQPIKQEIPVSTTISKELREQADDSQQFKLLQQQQHQQQINLMKMNWGDDPDITFEQTNLSGQVSSVKEQLSSNSINYKNNPHAMQEILEGLNKDENPDNIHIHHQEQSIGNNLSLIGKNQVDINYIDQNIMRNVIYSDSTKIQNNIIEQQTGQLQVEQDEYEQFDTKQFNSEQIQYIQQKESQQEIIERMNNEEEERLQMNRIETSLIKQQVIMKQKEEQVQQMNEQLQRKQQIILDQYEQEDSLNQSGQQKNENDFISEIKNEMSEGKNKKRKRKKKKKSMKDSEVEVTVGDADDYQDENEQDNEQDNENDKKKRKKKKKKKKKKRIKKEMVDEEVGDDSLNSEDVLNELMKPSLIQQQFEQGIEEKGGETQQNVSQQISIVPITDQNIPKQNQESNQKKEKENESKIQLDSSPDENKLASSNEQVFTQIGDSLEKSDSNSTQNKTINSQSSNTGNEQQQQNANVNVNEKEKKKKLKKQEQDKQNTDMNNVNAGNGASISGDEASRINLEVTKRSDIQIDNDVILNQQNEKGLISSVGPSLKFGPIIDAPIPNQVNNNQQIQDIGLNQILFQDPKLNLIQPLNNGLNFNNMNMNLNNINMNMNNMNMFNFGMNNNFSNINNLNMNNLNMNNLNMNNMMFNNIQNMNYMFNNNQQMLNIQNQPFLQGQNNLIQQQLQQQQQQQQTQMQSNLNGQESGIIKQKNFITQQIDQNYGEEQQGFETLKSNGIKSVKQLIEQTVQSQQADDNSINFSNYVIEVEKKIFTSNNLLLLKLELTEQEDNEDEQQINNDTSVRNKIKDKEWETKLDDLIHKKETEFKSVPSPLNEQLIFLISLSVLVFASAGIIPVIFLLIYSTGIGDNSASVMLAGFREVQFMQTNLFMLEFIANKGEITLKDPLPVLPNALTSSVVIRDFSHVSTNVSHLQLLMQKSYDFMQQITSAIMLGTNMKSGWTQDVKLDTGTIECNEDVIAVQFSNGEYQCPMKNESLCFDDRIYDYDTYIGYDLLNARYERKMEYLTLEDADKLKMQMKDSDFGFISTASLFDLQMQFDQYTQTFQTNLDTSMMAFQNVNLIVLIVQVVLYILTLLFFSLSLNMRLKSIWDETSKLRRIMPEGSGADLGIWDDVEMGSGNQILDEGRQRIWEQAGAVWTLAQSFSTRSDIKNGCEELMSNMYQQFRDEERYLKKKCSKCRLDRMSVRKLAMHAAEHVLIRQRMTILSDALTDKKDSSVFGALPVLVVLLNLHFKLTDKDLEPLIMQSSSSLKSISNQLMISTISE